MTCVIDSNTYRHRRDLDEKKQKQKETLEINTLILMNTTCSHDDTRSPNDSKLSIY